MKAKMMKKNTNAHAANTTATNLRVSKNSLPECFRDIIKNMVLEASMISMTGSRATAVAASMAILVVVMEDLVIFKLRSLIVIFILV